MTSENDLRLDDILKIYF